MTTVTNTIIDVTGTPVPDVYVEIILVSGPQTAFVENEEILSRVVLRTDSDGQWEVNLIPNSDITPTDTYYQVIHRVVGVSDRISTFIVPADGATPVDHPLAELLI